MKRNIILFSVLATLAISACGGKKTNDENKQAKLDALKKKLPNYSPRQVLSKKNLTKNQENPMVRPLKSPKSRRVYSKAIS